MMLRPLAIYAFTHQTSDADSASAGSKRREFRHVLSLTVLSPLCVCACHRSVRAQRLVSVTLAWPSRSTHMAYRWAAAAVGMSTGHGVCLSWNVSVSVSHQTLRNL